MLHYVHAPMTGLARWKGSRDGGKTLHVHRMDHTRKLMQMHGHGLICAPYHEASLWGTRTIRPPVRLIIPTAYSVAKVHSNRHGGMCTSNIGACSMHLR